MRVALYLRVSTDEQASSVETQERGAHTWCEAQGHEIVATYRDVGVSGAEWTRRPGLLSLQADAALPSRSWSLVVVRDVDRLGRDGVRLPLLLSTLAEHGVSVIEYSTGQPLGLDGVGQLVVSVRACLAQIERELNAGRVRTAHRQQHLDGRVTGGRVYGYRNCRAAGGVYHEIDEAEAETVREIYARAAAGESLRAIAHSLNAAGVSPPAGGRRTGSWSPGAILVIVRSPRYRGEIAWGALTKAYRAGTQIRRPGAEVLTIQAPHLAIVGADLWARAQSRATVTRAAAGQPPARREARHLLIGLARCGLCGGPLGSASTRQGKASVPAYRCAWAHDRGTCAASWRRWTHTLDTIVRDWVVGLLDATVIAAALDLARADLTAATTDGREAALRSEERTLSTSIARLVLAIEHGGDVPELVRRLAELRRRLAEVQSDLRSREALGALPSDVDGALAEAVADLRGALERDLLGARAVLRALLVAPITVTPDTAQTPRRLTLEGTADFGRLLGATTGGLDMSPGGHEHTPRLRVALRRLV